MSHVRRFDHVGITVADLDAVTAFFLALGLEAEGGPILEPESFLADFHLLTVQRKLKDAGRFVFIDRVKKNPSFLPYIGPSLRYVREALSRRPELADLGAILSRAVPELS